MNAYNYTTQRWTEGTEAQQLIKAQLTESIELLNSDQGPAYAAFIGVTDRLAAIALYQQQLDKLDAIEMDAFCFRCQGYDCIC